MIVAEEEFGVEGLDYLETGIEVLMDFSINSKIVKAFNTELFFSNNLGVHDDFFKRLECEIGLRDEELEGLLGKLMVCGACLAVVEATSNSEGVVAVEEVSGLGRRNLDSDIASLSRLAIK